MATQSGSEQKRLSLDDLSVGQVFRSGTHTVDAQQIKAFASQFDPQPFHLDEEAAKNSFFGELVASGWHTAGITMRLLVTSTPVDGGVIGAGGEISWPRATKPGDTLRVESEVVEIRPSKNRPDRGTVVMRSTTYNQNNDPVQIMKSTLVVFRRK
ncbi:MAG TPA: MaoC family dehydratase [Candidatus Obscuribacterales bacterium]